MTTQLCCTQCKQTQFQEELIHGYLCSYCFSDSLVEREYLEEQAERAIDRINDHFLARVMDGVA